MVLSLNFMIIKFPPTFEDYVCFEKYIWKNDDRIKYIATENYIEKLFMNNGFVSLKEKTKSCLFSIRFEILY